MIRLPRSIGRRGARVTGPRRRPGSGRRHAYYLAIGFPPAAQDCADRLRATANQLVAQGWDVTVITAGREAWEREFGLDPSLADLVDPRIRVVEVPLVRADLDTDIRAFTEERSVDPAAWAVEAGLRDRELFPEPHFGAWRPVLERAILDLHRRDPADLLVTTCAPFVSLAPTWRLWEEHRVPYVVDLRAGWSVTATGAEAFTPVSIAGRWESKVLAGAVAVWCAEEPVAEHYRTRYPQVADRITVVPDGYDDAALPPLDRAGTAGTGLRFGYLGTITFPTALLTAVLDGWRKARAEDPALADATLEFRVRSGIGAAREDNAAVELLRTASEDGVRTGGPAPRSATAQVYAGWDVQLLIASGGRYASSGRAYEALATGMPVVSVHEADHPAAHVLAGSPLWTGAVGHEVDLLAESFRKAARLALTATREDRQAARAAAAGHTRTALLEPVVRQVTATVLGTSAHAGEQLA
jgi:hypothetical protein